MFHGSPLKRGAQQAKCSITAVMEEGSHSDGSRSSGSDGSGSDGSDSDRSNRDGGFSHGSSSLSSSSSDHDSFGRRWERRRRDDDSSPEDDVRRTPRNSDCGEDRISELPDSILIHILSCMPFTDVIATASLSKRWRFLWKMVPNLDFRLDPHSSEWGHQAPISLIDKALLLHESSRIKKFSVGFNYCSRHRSSLDVWLCVATGKNVEDINLELKLDSWGKMYTLSKHLYTNSSLVKLTLRACSMKPNAAISWPSLKTLSIGDYTELNDNQIESILSGSPVLESLELTECTGISRLNITSASLKKLVIKSCNVLQISAPKVDSLSITGSAPRDLSLNLPSLRRANIDLVLRREREGSYKKTGRLMMYLLETLSSVEELTIGDWCIQVISVLEGQKLTSPISTCKRLTLNTRCTQWDLPGMANLLSSSVSVETLVINSMTRNYDREIVLIEEDGCRKLSKFYGKLDDKKYWSSQEGAFVSSIQCLKTVKIIDGFISYRGIELVLRLLQVLLKNARMLEKVVICTSRNVKHGSLNTMRVTRRLLSFPKASPSAVILYHRS